MKPQFYRIGTKIREKRKIFLDADRLRRTKKYFKIALILLLDARNHIFSEFKPKSPKLSTPEYPKI